ncbi:sulfate adenylyltransferase subunit CysD [Aliidiomarina sanyensis]|uniref:Sulfate adenylyltransferase subunit 2 n=1 Tax=Aliidiomarina sanyensis TaxID=1249555 RepID=A0A432WNP3_9GAMM|nr:sulfate adenylyltransferase subunit CysD [Aliidiomarina sanyensis]RUO35358.1 sulfate adenylyltransferase subunit CysD [Aliidiomarina sanyensis]
MGDSTSVNQSLSHLAQLESEAIAIFREVVAQMANPVLLYSIGKDSSVLLHLARKAFAPEPLPFPLLHIDTTWKFREMIAFRDATAEKFGLDLHVYTQPQGQADGLTPFSHGSARYTDVMKTQALREALARGAYDAAFGGARRDEERSRAKERVFSHRNSEQRWDPKNQRPELWGIFNGACGPGESFRVFPLSNWTEQDIWQYIAAENIAIPSLYFAKERPCVQRDGKWFMVDDDRFPLLENEQPVLKRVRFRTLGCYPLTAAIESDATTVAEIIEEMAHIRVSEREGRLIDSDSPHAMEQKKREGYF